MAISFAVSDGSDAMKMDFCTLVHPLFCRNLETIVLTLLLLMSYMMKHIIYPGLVSDVEMILRICLILSVRVGMLSGIPTCPPIAGELESPAFPMSRASMI